MRIYLSRLLAGALVLSGFALVAIGVPSPVLTSKVYAADLKGSESKGRYYFRQTCKTCHTKGATGGEVTPLNKTQSQWKSYFTAAKHNHGKEALSKVMSEEQLRDVAAFLREHASDSLQPETCGK